jgi:calreticulin
MKGFGALFAAVAPAALGKVYFLEEFKDDSWRDRWVDSEWKKDAGSQGSFALNAGKYHNDPSVDQGLKTQDDARHFTTSATFEPFSNEGKTLVIQYQMKHEQDIECGGGYIKIGAQPDDQKKFGDPTPYYIMFGPDQCGYSAKRTHLIFSYKGKNLLRKTDLPWESDKLSHLFRLVLNADNTYEVFIDGESKGKGNLKEDWDFLPPKKVNDPNEKKPDDWVDEKKIDDPEDKKPDDWVEEKRIVDKDAKKPDDWDDEEDGEWEPPMIDNPDFKGEWKARRIDNPAYKGEWVHPQIDNPDYKDDNELYKYDNIGFVGIDLWQVKGGTIFDNFIITDDVKEADELADRTWKKLVAAEKEKKAAEDEAERKRKEEEEKKRKEAEKDEDDDDIDAAVADDEEM